jgi:hypothetical protein
MADPVAAWRIFEQGELRQQGKALAELRRNSNRATGPGEAGPAVPTVATQGQLDALLAVLRAVASATRRLNERFAKPCP